MKLLRRIRDSFRFSGADDKHIYIKFVNGDYAQLIISSMRTTSRHIIVWKYDKDGRKNRIVFERQNVLFMKEWLRIDEVR